MYINTLSAAIQELIQCAKRAEQNKSLKFMNLIGFNYWRRYNLKRAATTLIESDRNHNSLRIVLSGRRFNSIRFNFDSQTGATLTWNYENYIQGLWLTYY